MKITIFPRTANSRQRALIVLRVMGPLVLLAGVTLWAIVALHQQRAHAASGGSATERLAAGRYFPSPLVWVGTTPPGEEESELLWETLEQWKASDGTAGLAELEEFVATLTNSAWAPSLRVNLGLHYRSRAQITRALAHWQVAWDATKGFASGNGKTVADYALAHYTRLLVLLGRTDELAAIYQAHGDRMLDRGHLSQMWLRTHEKYIRMHKYPEDSWKCGIHALALVADSLQLKYKKGEFLRTPSKSSGFSLQELQELSHKYGFGLVTVRRSENSGQLIVPSVVHWRAEHYTAIIEQRGDTYRMADPARFGVLWLTEAEINAEASGYFLIPQNQISVNFTQASAAEAELVFGRDGSCPPEDWEDIPCPPGAGSGGTGNGGAGPNGSGGNGAETGDGGPVYNEAGASVVGPINCQSCGGGGGGGSGGDEECCEEEGLPKWRVTEPYLNVWIDDVPIRYMAAKGPPVVLKMRYKQRNEYAVEYLSLPRVGANWSCNWFSLAYVSEGGANVVLPGGGDLAFEFPANSNWSHRQYRNNSQLESLTNSSVLAGYVLHFADGRQLKYTKAYSGGIFQLSEQIDPQGNKLTFNYTGNLVSSITDADANATLLYYTNSLYLARVATPDGREIALTHDEYGQLTNLVDAAGLASSLTYNAWGYGPASLTTPYGTTYFDVSGGFFVADRSVIITEPSGSRYAFALWHRNTNVPSAFASSQLPTNTSFATGGYPYGTLEITNRHERNTFYWNPQQFASLGTTNFADFTWAELKRARIRHWLGKFSPDSDNHVDTLGHEQAPSANGTDEGPVNWFDYAGKDYDAPELRGAQVVPAVIARVMPDGSTWYQYFEPNTNGHPTKAVEKWASGNTALYRTNTFNYDANNVDMVLHLGPTGEQVVSNYFNAYHQVLASYDALNQETRYTYDGTTRLLTSITRPTGLVTTNLYDGDDRLQETTDQPINATRTYTWGEDGNLETMTDERGLTVTYYWDGLNRLTGTSYPDGTTTTNLYTVGSTKILDLTATKDRLGYWTYFGYDALRRKIAETNANGVVTRYGYCDCGSGVTAITNAWNTAVEFVTQFDYDYLGNRTVIHYPDATVTNWYDSLQRLYLTADAWGSRGFYYDNLNRLTNISNAYGAEQTTVFDIEDHPIYVTDANGVTVTNAFDELGRLRTRTYPDAGVERFGYSARGLVAYTNQLDKITYYGYDEAMRKTWETNANNEILRYTNNAAGDLLSLTDGKNQTTRWNYDEYGRVTNKLDQAAVEILRYQYDPDSRLTNRWSKAKGDTKYKYDPVGNLTNVDYAVSTDVKFQYDPLNRVTNMVDASGTTKYAYTAGGFLWTEDGPFSSDAVTNSYTYRMRTGLALQQPTGMWTNGFWYDYAKRLTNVTSPAGTFSYQYLNNQPSTLIQKLALPNTSYITNTYDTVARLLSTKLNNSSHTALDAYSYIYNPGNQRTNLTRTDSSTVAYSYDPIGQLKVANSSVNPEDRGYLYDAAWNLNKRTNNGAVTTFTANNKNELNDFLGNYDYDDNGNLIGYREDLPLYEYDDENQLIVIEHADGWRAEFVYDGTGRLRKRLEYTGTIGDWTLASETRYVYDGKRVIQERNGSDTPAVSYTRGTDLSGSLEGAGGIGGLLARSHGYSSGNWSTHNFYHADGGGNVTYLVNSSQTLAASYRYDPYGNTISSSGTLASANVYRFSSKELHVNSGLYYYGYRWYHPNLQRWLNRDPLGEIGFETSLKKRSFVLMQFVEAIDLSNLYVLVNNNPVMYSDRDGRQIWQLIPKSSTSIGGNPRNCILISQTDPIKGDPAPRKENHNGDTLCIWRCNDYGDQVPSGPPYTYVTFAKPNTPCKLPKGCNDRTGKLHDYEKPYFKLPMDYE